ncbi:MAG: GNAT family N-acetyltransferase [Oscillospiraceae bacterium]|nr:GNAT family N-acetyltransferase [Oscillospiraceae bacterium]
MPLEIKLAYDDLDSLKELFAEYVNLLFGLEHNFQEYLDLQAYDDEIDNLSEKYGLPSGRLYIAYLDKQVSGCIALRRIDDTTCEMKRLYVRPAFRGHNIGAALVETIVRDAKESGYQSMLLDSLPALKQAIALYERVGFYNIPPYNDSPVARTVFMKLDL